MTHNSIKTLIDRLNNFAVNDKFCYDYIRKYLKVYYKQETNEYSIVLKDRKYVYQQADVYDQKAIDNLYKAITEHIKTEQSKVLFDITNKDISLDEINRTSNIVEEVVNYIKLHYNLGSQNNMFKDGRVIMIDAANFGVNEMLICKLSDGKKVFAPITINELKTLLGI